MAKQGTLLEYGTVSVNALANPKFAKESTDIWNTILTLITQVQHLQKKNGQVPITRLPTRVKQELVDDGDHSKDIIEIESSESGYIKGKIIQELRSKVEQLLKQVDESEAISSNREIKMKNLRKEITELKNLNKKLKSEKKQLTETKEKLKADSLALRVRFQQVRSENDLLRRQDQLQRIIEPVQNNIYVDDRFIGCSPTEDESEVTQPTQIEPTQPSVKPPRPLQPITNNLLVINRPPAKCETNRKPRVASVPASFSDNFTTNQITPIKLEKRGRQPSLELEFSDNDQEEEDSMREYYDDDDSIHVKQELDSSILEFSQKPPSQIQPQQKINSLSKRRTIEDSQMDDMSEYGEPLISDLPTLKNQQSNLIKLDSKEISETETETGTETETESEHEEDPILDLSFHPIRGGNWWPEDFRPNEVVNDGYDVQFKTRRVAAHLVHPVRKLQNDLQNKHLKEYAMKDFNRLAGPGILPKTPTLTRKPGPLPTPLKTPETAFENPKIDSVFKFQINRKNYNKFKNHLNLNSKKVPTELEVDEDSPPGHERSDFPTTQQVLSDKEKSVKREKIKALQRLFQAVCVVQADYGVDNNGKKRKCCGNRAVDYSKLEVNPNTVVYEQVGNFVFKNENFNKAVRNNKFKIDESIFYDSDDV